VFLISLVLQMWTGIFASFLAPVMMMDRRDTNQALTDNFMAWSGMAPEAFLLKHVCKRDDAVREEEQFPDGNLPEPVIWEIKFVKKTVDGIPKLWCPSLGTNPWLRWWMTTTCVTDQQSAAMYVILKEHKFLGEWPCSPGDLILFQGVMGPVKNSKEPGAFRMEFKVSVNGQRLQSKMYRHFSVFDLSEIITKCEEEEEVLVKVEIPSIGKLVEIWDAAISHGRCSMLLRLLTENLPFLALQLWHTFSSGKATPFVYGSLFMSVMVGLQLMDSILSDVSRAGPDGQSRVSGYDALSQQPREA